MKKRLLLMLSVILPIVLMMFPTNSFAANFNGFNKNGIKEIVVEEYPLIDNLKELTKIAHKNVVLPDGKKVIANLNGKEVPCYTAIEKVRNTKNISTGEEKTLYRITSLAYDTEADIQSLPDQRYRKDPPYTTGAGIRAYYEGSRTRNNIIFKRVSKWEGMIETLDTQARYPFACVYSKALGETYDYDSIGSWPYIPATFERQINYLSTWYSLYTPWANEYIACTGAMGQMGGTYVEITRAFGGETWTLEVKLNYGLTEHDYDS